MVRTVFRISPWIAAAAVLLMLTPQAARGADAPEAYSSSLAFFHNKQFREAIASLEPYLAANPRDARALVLRGDSRAELGDNKGALVDFNAAIASAPDYEYAYVTRCETRLQLDDLDGSLADCNAAVRLDASDGHAFEDRGDVQFQRQAYGPALADYDRAVVLGRNSAYVFAARCDTERLVGKRDAAAADCRQALTIDPKSRRGLWARARLAMAEARFADGAGDMSSYIQLNPAASTTAYYFRGYAYNFLKRYADALTDLRLYVGRAPDDADGYRERGIALYGSGDTSGALADLQAAVTRYRKSGDTEAATHVDEMIATVRAGKTIVR